MQIINRLYKIKYRFEKIYIYINIIKNLITNIINKRKHLPIHKLMKEVGIIIYNFWTLGVINK